VLPKHKELFPKVKVFTMNEEAIYQLDVARVGRREEMKGIPRLYISILLNMYNGVCWVQAIMHGKVHVSKFGRAKMAIAPNMLHSIKIFELKGFINFNEVIWDNFMDPVKPPTILG
jgi:hypothetical protein